MAAVAAAPAAGSAAGGSSVAGSSAIGGGGSAMAGASTSYGMTLAGQLTNFGLSQWAAGKQYKRQKKLMSSRYQMMVADLRAAGLNPILAVASPPPLPGVPLGGFGNATSGESHLRAGKEIAKLKPELKMLNAELALKQSQIQINSATAVREREAAVTEHWKSKREEIGAGMDLRREPASKEQHNFDRTPLGQRALIINRWLRNVFGQPQSSAR